MRRTLVRRSPAVVSWSLAGTILASALLWTACGGSPAPAPAQPVVTAPDEPAPPPRPEAPPPGQILAQSDLPEPLATPVPGDPLGVTIHRLSNGLTVYISTDRQSPRFSAWVAVRAGSRHDPASSTGLAHYLEHMLFKGTDELGTLDAAAEAAHLERIAALYNDLRATEDPARRREIMTAIDTETQASAKYAIPNELDQLYAKLGVRQLNAFTSDEQTVYIADVPSNRFAAWARVEAERFRDPRFRLFYPELEAVYEEKNISLDDPRNRVFETMARALFPQHPYGTQPTIGLVEHLKTPAYADMVAYFRRWYVPNNIAIVLAGDVDAETALPVLEQYFGAWQPRPLEAPTPAPLPPVQGRQLRELTAPGEAEVYLAWKTVSANDPDEPALAVLDWLMDNATAGLINVELVLSQKLPQAGSFPQNLIESGTWTMYGTAREGQSLEEVEALLLGVVEKVKAGDFTQADLDAVVLNAEIREMRETESNWARVAKMTDAYVNHTPWTAAAKRSEVLRKVTREDVMRVASEYLTGDYVAVYRKKGAHTPPKIDKPKITPVAIDPARKSKFAAEVLEMPASPVEPEWLKEGTHYARRKLPGGDLVLVPNRVNELFSLMYHYDFGYSQSPLVCEALELMEQSGTGKLGPAELKRKLYAMGTTVRVQCDEDSIALTVEGIDRNLEESVALLDGWLRKPALSQDTWDKLVANTISQRKDETEDPESIAEALTAYARRGKNSEYLTAPSNKTLRATKIAPLGKLLAGLPDTRHRTFYFGPRAEPGKVVTLGRKHRPAPASPPRTYRKVDGTRIFFVDKETAQSQISIALPKEPLPRGDRPLSKLFTEYVGGGMGALIFQEIREARGLAYGAWGYHSMGRRPVDQSAVIAGMGTQSDKTVEALRTMLELLRNLPVQAARLGTAKLSLDEEYRSSRFLPRQVPTLVLAWDDLGEPEDPRPSNWKVIQASGEAELVKFAERFRQGDLIISVMGDGARIDLDALGKIAPVEKVPVEQLFGY
jgi:predicted Zn-dependent peptidase